MTCWRGYALHVEHILWCYPPSFVELRISHTGRVHIVEGRYDRKSCCPSSDCALLSCSSRSVPSGRERGKGRQQRRRWKKTHLPSIVTTLRKAQRLPNSSIFVEPKMVKEVSRAFILGVPNIPTILLALAFFLLSYALTSWSMALLSGRSFWASCQSTCPHGFSSSSSLLSVCDMSRLTIMRI